MIVERVKSGLARAKAKGVKLGRGNKKDGERNADEERWGMSRAWQPLGCSTLQIVAPLQRFPGFGGAEPV
jgi:hypothetical protein